MRRVIFNYIIVACLQFNTSIASIPKYSQLSDVSEKLSIEHHNKALYYDEEGIFDRASVEYKKALLHNPDNINSLFNLGLIYLKVNNPAEAVVILKRLILLAPYDYEAYNLLGIAYSGVGDKSAAIDIWNKSLLINKEQPDVLNMLNEFTKLSK